jgi:hypothetical protein
MPTTVVIIDDHPSFRASARAILQAEGFEVVGEAEDGSSGIAAARACAGRDPARRCSCPDMDRFASAGSSISTAAHRPSFWLKPGRSRLRRADRAERCARGFIPKDELGGTALADLLG